MNTELETNLEAAFFPNQIETVKAYAAAQVREVLDRIEKHCLKSIDRPALNEIAAIRKELEDQ